MSGPRRWACAAVVGVALTVTVGCKATDFSLLAVIQGPAGKDCVVAGSLETVATSLQAKLSGLGLVAVITPEGEAVRIRSTSRTGQRFSLLLSSVTTSAGVVQTNVRVVWEGKPDEQTETQLLANVEVKKAP